MKVSYTCAIISMFVQTVTCAMPAFRLNMMQEELKMRDCLFAKDDFHIQQQDHVVECGEHAVGNVDAKCALECTAGALTVYWACAAACVKAEASEQCILTGCPAAVAAFDVPCLKQCPAPSLSLNEA